jgi:hypothetical protein
VVDHRLAPLGNAVDFTAPAGELRFLGGNAIV